VSGKTSNRAGSIWNFAGLGPRELIHRVWRAFDEHDLPQRASDLAYNSLLAAFPAILLLLAILGLSASHGPALQQTLIFSISRTLPPSAFRLVSDTITEASKNSGGAKLTIGVLISLLAALSSMTSMMAALNCAHGVAETRSWWKVRGIALALTALLSALILFALLVVFLGDQIADLAGTVLRLEDIVVAAWKLMQWVVALVFMVISFSLVYYFGPNLGRRRWHWLTPGSVFGVLLWFAATFSFRAYLHFFNTYSKTYGSLGAAIILLVWLYVAGLAFLIGGEIDAAIEAKALAASAAHPGS